MKLLRRIWPYVLLAILVAINVTAWIQRESIADWWRLRNYQAPKDISSLVSDTTMTDKAEHLFYINHPSLENKQDFNRHCSDRGEETAVLGCYHGDRRGIYLYAVKDERLQGVRQVTAAHEMLHQAYDRLSANERERIGVLLRAYYDAGLMEEDVKSKIDSYKEQPDTDLTNEMHSIFGSEVRQLTPDLEEYYKQYFDDRLKVVTFSEAYQGEFTRRKELIKQYDAQLSNLKEQINSNKSELSDKATYLRDKEKEIQQDTANQNQPEYEADVNAYNSVVDAYNNQLSATRRLIEQYNTIVEERNSITVQEQELQQALDSRPAPRSGQ